MIQATHSRRLKEHIAGLETMTRFVLATLERGGLTIRDIEALNVANPDMPIAFADFQLFSHLGLDQRPAILLGMAISSLAVARWGIAGRATAKADDLPGGFSVVMKRDLPADVRARISKWFASAVPGVGLPEEGLHGAVDVVRRAAVTHPVEPVGAGR